MGNEIGFFGQVNPALGVALGVDSENGPTASYFGSVKSGWY